MLKTTYRLNRKDINYMTGKGKPYFGQIFIFSKIPQYPNRKYNQISINIPNKLSKLSSTRHKIRRKVIGLIQDSDFVSRSFGDKNYKVFVFLNKKCIADLTTVTYSKSELVSKLYDSFTQERNKFIATLTNSR